jgi:hypothetical protein
MKLFVHVLGLDHRFVTACDDHLKVRNVREALQSEHATLFPSTWPLAFHCLKDPKGFLISDNLEIGQATEDGGLVYAVHEHQTRETKPLVSISEVSYSVSRYGTVMSCLDTNRIILVVQPTSCSC